MNAYDHTLSLNKCFLNEMTRIVSTPALLFINEGFICAFFEQINLSNVLTKTSEK